MNLIEKLKANKVLPIIRSRDPHEAVNIVNALLDGGLDMVEINVETPAIFNAIRAVSNSATVCAGGIITSIQAQTAIECGAKVLSSPIFQSNLLKISKDRQVPLIAGSSTPNEAYNAWKSRIPVVKIYPVTAMGGVEYIENMLRPMPFLNVIPQSNVQLNEVKDYINAGATAVGVGRHLTCASTYSEITVRTKKLLESLN